jgi:hypothetical protein
MLIFIFSEKKKTQTLKMKKDKRRKEHKLAGRCRGFGAPTRVYVRD